MESVCAVDYFKTTFFACEVTIVKLAQLKKEVCSEPGRITSQALNVTSYFPCENEEVRLTSRIIASLGKDAKPVV